MTKSAKLHDPLNSAENIEPSRFCVLLCALVLSVATVRATPANKAALAKHYDRFLSVELNRCTTCHLPSSTKNPETLEEFPHNSFGARLRVLGEELRRSGEDALFAARIPKVAAEDADGDGIANEDEILLGSNPGDSGSRPTNSSLLSDRKAAYADFLREYRWRPFETPERPQPPVVRNAGWVRNAIDAFVMAEHEKRGLRARPEAPREILLRRAYLDLIGLAPTIEEQEQFLSDSNSDAYEKLIDRLLEDKRYGERWGRHWMDVWRYSDWAGWSGGNQIRDSKPHIWRWKEWIIESLNKDKSYATMLVEMLAADEIAPGDTNMLRATGFLVRNYKMLSREQWLEDTIKHTSQAFMGVTIGCAKCHDHMYDPVTQAEYYQMRAVFEPHDVRTDRVPGELDRGKSGLVRTYDKIPEPPTYFFTRGDERKPDTNRLIRPGVPAVLSRGISFAPETIALPKSAALPDRREFVVADLVRASEQLLVERQKALESAPADREILLKAAIAETRHAGLLSELRAEHLENTGEKGNEEYREVALETLTHQKKAALLEAKLELLSRENELRAAELKAGEAIIQRPADQENKQNQSAAAAVENARKRLEESRTKLAATQLEFDAVPTENFKTRGEERYPDQSSGRRLAFAKWLTDPKHPLTARVAANHIWLRHFGRGIAGNPADFGANSAPPTHPQLLDWLAAEFVAQGWSMKRLHRLVMTSNAYRMASTGDEQNAAIDPDNFYLWRMNSRRVDAEVVRDNLLHVAGNMDYTVGGPDIPHTEGLTSKRRSLYLRIAAEKEVEFLKIFDGPAVTECYVRHPTVMPQQALALANSELAMSQARVLAASLAHANVPEEFARIAYQRVLARTPKSEELQACVDFLSARQFDARARENLALVLFNHSDFVTVR